MSLRDTVSLVIRHEHRSINCTQRSLLQLKSQRPLSPYLYSHPPKVRNFHKMFGPKTEKKKDAWAALNQGFRVRTDIAVNTACFAYGSQEGWKTQAAQRERDTAAGQPNLTYVTDTSNGGSSTSSYQGFMNTSSPGYKSRSIMDKLRGR